MPETILPSKEWELLAPYLPVIAVEIDKEKLDAVTYRGKKVFNFKEKPDNEDLKNALRRMAEESFNQKNLKEKIKKVGRLMV